LMKVECLVNVIILVVSEGTMLTRSAESYAEVANTEAQEQEQEQKQEQEQEQEQE
jgi:hypothetical protein